MSKHLLNIFSDTIDPAGYIGRIWNDVFPWQREALDPSSKRIMLLCARQSGKSTIVAGRALHQAKHFQDSLVLIVSPSEKQSKETIQKVADYISCDPELTAAEMKGDSAFEKKFKNGSRIIALPGTEQSVRGYSNPSLIIMDEAARILDETFRAVVPMLTDPSGNPKGVLILLSTPWNMTGFFHEIWTKPSDVWKKIYVVPKFRMEDGKFFKRIPEADFREIMAKKDISAYYSPRHTEPLLREFLGMIGPIWFKREFDCEFLEGSETLFDLELIESMYDSSVEQRKTGDSDEDGNEMFCDGIKPKRRLEEIFE